MSTEWNPVYIGDAVYVFFDGCGIKLKLSSHESECIIYLEPDVMQNLQMFWDRCRKEAVEQLGE